MSSVDKKINNTTTTAKSPALETLPDQLQFESGDIILFRRRCRVKPCPDNVFCAATWALQKKGWDHIGILVESGPGQFRVAELTTQGVLLHDFHDRILYSRSEEIAVRKLALTDDSLRKRIPEIINGFPNIRHVVSVRSAFPWGKKRQNYQLKLMGARKTLEDVEEDIRQSKNLSEFQKRSLDAERIKLLQWMEKYKSLAGIDKQTDVSLDQLSGREGPKSVSLTSAEFVWKVFSDLGIIQDEIENPHPSLFSSQKTLPLLRGASLGAEIFIRSPSLKIDDEHVSPHAFMSLQSLPGPVNEKEFKLIEDCLQNNPMFSQLRYKQHKDDFIRLFRKQTFSEGETITVEGSLNHGFYIIESGEVEVSMMTRSGKPKLAGVLASGQSFGKLGLSPGEPAASSVKARTNVTVWIVDAPTFHRYAESTRRATHMGEKPAFHSQLVKAIRNQEIFSNLSDLQVEELSLSFFRVPTREGDLLTRQGFMGDFFYIVQDGEYEVYVARPGKIPQLVDNIRPGGSFGSLSLLYNNPRAATVKCKKEGAVWAVDRQTFLKFAGTGPTYVQDAFEKYATVNLGNQKFMTPEDFLRAVRSTHKDITDDSAMNFKDLMVQIVDRTGSKLISFADFLLFDELMASPNPERQLAFFVLDADKDGVIGFEDLKRHYSQHQVEAMMQLNLEEFSEVLKTPIADKKGIPYSLFEQLCLDHDLRNMPDTSALKLKYAFRSIFMSKFHLIASVWQNSILSSYDGFEIIPTSGGKLDLNAAKSLLAGGIAGAVSRTATSPLERLKVMKQVQTDAKYQGVISSLRQMYREEGFLSYWKGNGTNVLRIAPYSAIQFFSFDVYKKAFASKEGSNGTLSVLLAGGLAGMTSTIFCYPLDLVRAILTVQTTSQVYSGMNDAIVSIFRKDGVRGLYKGLTPTLLGIAPYIAVNFATFDKLKTKFLPDKKDKYFDLMNLGLGAIAGATAVTLTYPSDVLRRKMQLNGLAELGMPAYDGIADCIRKVYANEGIGGFYRGLVPCYLKVVPSMAIAFMTYERLRSVLGFEGGKAPSS